MLFKLISIFLPWSLKRRALKSWFGFDIHPQAYIGFAWIFPKNLIMGPGAIIDHFTVAINLDRIQLEKSATIGRNNWITGFPLGSKSLHFKHQSDRQAELVIGESAAITKSHHFDCTNLIKIGKFSTVAGYNSQFLTHSIDVFENRQDSAPIIIGDYCFIGTNVVAISNSSLPSYSVLGAKSLLNRNHTEEWTLYGGTPAIALKPISKDAKYFSRKNGYVI